eukprot:7722573-Pyramimonas_sp.AAC.2
MCAEWKFAKNELGEVKRAIRLRRALRGFVGVEAFDVETFSGTVRRASRRLFASATAPDKLWIMASMGI